MCGNRDYTKADQWSWDSVQLETFNRDLQSELSSWHMLQQLISVLIGVMVLGALAGETDLTKQHAEVSHILKGTLWLITTN